MTKRYPNASQDAVFPTEAPQGDATGPPHGVASISAADTIRRLRLAARLTRDPGRSTLRPRTAVLFDTAADELESVASDNQRLREALVLIAAEVSDGWAVSVARTALDEEAT